MPQKKPSVGRHVSAISTELKAVRLELPVKIHKELRIEAARQDRSMASLVRGLVKEYLITKKGPK